MEDLRRQFALDAVVKLKRLSGDLSGGANDSESFKRDAFRALHTIKGTAQTFGMPAAGFLAHELENRLAADDAASDVFRIGLEALIASLEKTDYVIPESVLEIIGGSPNLRPDRQSKTNPAKLPEELTRALSAQEKAALDAAQRAGRNLYGFEIGFPLADFADGLIEFRQTLSAAGEIIATLPSERFGGDQIGFRVLYASRRTPPEIERLAAGSRARVIFDASAVTQSSDLQAAAAHAVRHGQAAAEKLGKQIVFEIAADRAPVPENVLKIAFGAVLHLIRNAVDHGIESVGTIKIEIQTRDADLRIAVSDDGRGINAEAIKRRAARGGLIDDAAANISEQTALDLIFLPEFSTKTEVTEISGRGVGLDAVKTSVEEAGGSVSVRSAPGEGTTFEISLPLDGAATTAADSEK